MAVELKAGQKKEFFFPCQRVNEVAKSQLTSLPGVDSHPLHWESTGRGWGLGG